MPKDMTIPEQIFNLIDKSEQILLLTHAKADCDGLGSMISMYLSLKKLGKEVIAATNDPAPDNLSFLPSISIVQNSLKSVEDFIITLDISRTPLKKIRYHLEEKENGQKTSKVNIIITPKIGQFSQKDVSFLTPEGQDMPSFDLIITFDTGNLEHLGPLYDKNSELFFKTPIINIDHHASNTDFGQVNLVDVVAASTTEVMLDLLKEMEKKYDETFIDEDIATLLLAGLITDTGSFQHANTSPNAMEVAAELLDLGARQQEIIKKIYKSKNLSTLKLWGTILSKVHSDPIYRVVWSSISKEDLKEAEATSDESEGIIDDLLSNAPGAEIIMLFKWNEEGYISVSMRSTTNSADVGKIAAEMGGGGHVRAAGFKIRDGKSLEEVIQMSLKKVKEYQSKRLNIHPDTIHQPTAEDAKIRPTATAKIKKEPQVEGSAKEVKYLDFDRLDATDEHYLKEKVKKEDAQKGEDEAAEKQPEKESLQTTSEHTQAELPTKEDAEDKKVNTSLKEEKLTETKEWQREKKEEGTETPADKEKASPSQPSPRTAKESGGNPEPSPQQNAVPSWLNHSQASASNNPPVVDESKKSTTTPVMTPVSSPVASAPFLAPSNAPHPVAPNPLNPQPSSPLPHSVESLVVPNAQPAPIPPPPPPHPLAKPSTPTTASSAPASAPPPQPSVQPKQPVATPPPPVPNNPAPTILPPSAPAATPTPPPSPQNTQSPIPPPNPAA